MQKKVVLHGVFGTRCVGIGRGTPPCSPVISSGSEAIIARIASELQVVNAQNEQKVK